MTRSICAALLLITMASCAETDPYTTGGVWQPTGANARNIATMTVNKGDLIRGRGVTGSDGILAASAATRLWDGNPKPLPVVSSKSAGGG